MLYDNGDDVLSYQDEFRVLEKDIKSYFRFQQNRKYHKNRYGNSTKADANSFLHGEKINFIWDNIVDVRRVEMKAYSIHEEECTKYNLLTSSQAQIFGGFNNIPNGLYIISNAISPKQQLIWAKNAVTTYSMTEHTNLTNLAKINAQNKFTVNEQVQTKDDKENSSIQITLWDESVQENNNFRLFSKLRWSCLGYHYDWTARMYKKNLKSSFPEDLSILCKQLANLVNTSLEPEAAIVNFYPLGTTMGGHLDDAEHTMEKPIVSLSIGCSALFLIGSRDKSIKPTPILLRSGDVIIMSGESRFCYHGVAQIFPYDFNPIDDETFVNESPSEFFSYFESNEVEASDLTIIQYLRENRININTRQVTIDSTTWLDKAGTGAMK
eukprot:gene16249-22128_t